MHHPVRRHGNLAPSAGDQVRLGGLQCGLIHRNRKKLACLQLGERDEIRQESNTQALDDKLPQPIEGIGGELGLQSQVFGLLHDMEQLPHAVGVVVQGNWVGQQLLEWNGGFTLQQREPRSYDCIDGLPAGRTRYDRGLRGRIEDQADIGFIFADASHDFVGTPYIKHNRYPRKVGSIARQRARHQVGDEALAQCDSDRTLVQPAHFLQPRQQVILVHQLLAKVSQDKMTCLCCFHSTGMAFDERKRELLLQQRDLPAYRGRRHIQRIGRFAHRAATDGFEKVNQPGFLDVSLHFFCAPCMWPAVCLRVFFAANYSSTHAQKGCCDNSNKGMHPLLLAGACKACIITLPRPFKRADTQKKLYQNGGRMMKEAQLRDMIARVRGGSLSRRAFIQRVGALGLAAPLAGQLLSWHGVSMAAPAPEPLPANAQRGGPLRLLSWQGPTLLNPHFAIGSKDQEASRVFYEPLAGWDPEGRLLPILAAEVPSVENGSVSPDATSVTWKLKPNVKWHDGHPFTADDVVFNWQYASDPSTATITIGSYKDAHVEKVDDLTVRVSFDKSTPFWADAFVGVIGLIIPKHLFEQYKGPKSREAPGNLKPVGTGPYRFVEFRPGDVLKAERNPDYHMPGRPYFDTLEIKGGGDAVSAARAVLQTGEYDYAWNMLVEDTLLKRMEISGQGTLEIIYGGNIEFIQLNPTDPRKEVDGERSSIKTAHPLFSDPAVRQAMSMLIDRKSIQKYIYGRLGRPVRNFINAPERFVSHNIPIEYSLDKANAILDKAGWKRGADGVREKDGKRLTLLFQTSINAPRQKTQAVIKQACREAGIEIELKSINASVYFSADLANPESNTKFYADMQMYTQSMTEPDPQKFLTQFVSWEVASKANGWQGRNVLRWRNEKFDALFNEASREIDPVRRAAIYIEMNDLVVGGNNLQPLLHRAAVSARNNKITPFLSGWDNSLWRLPDWYRTA